MIHPLTAIWLLLGLLIIMELTIITRVCHLEEKMGWTLPAECEILEKYLE